MIQRALLPWTAVIGLGGSLGSSFAAAGLPPMNFAVSLGGQYAAHPREVETIAQRERSVYAIVPLRFETGFYLKFLPQLQTGVSARIDLESNFNPIALGGAKSIGSGALAVSARYVFPVVMGDGLSGPSLRLDAGLVALGTSHPSVPGLMWGLDTLMGVGYCVGLLENRSAVTLEVSYSPRFFSSGVGHSVGLMVGVLF